MRHLTKSFLVLLAALFSFSMAFAETGTETEGDQQNGNKNTTAEGQSYTIDGTYIAGTGSSMADPMTSKGLKFRTAQNGGTLEFTVRENYTITKLYMAAIGNYVADDNTLPYVTVTKVEVDGTEVDFEGGEFTEKGASEAGELTVDNISATQKIVLYFDNSNASAGTQLNASWVINWERPDATQPTITVTPKTLALLPGASSKLSVHVDPASFTTLWASSNEAVATVTEDGIVTAVAPGTANISNQWDADATVADAAVVTVAEFDPSAYTKTTYDFTAMGDVSLTLSEEAAGAIWNEGNKKANNVFFCTNEGLENIAVQAALSGGKGWSIIDGEGLVLASGAGRCAAIGNLKAGQIVEIIYTGNNFYTGSKNDAVRKDDGAPKTGLSEGIGRAIYQMDEDGLLGFELDRGKAVTQINVYSSSSMVTTTKTIGLIPGVWAADNATFAAYAWNDVINAWFPFVEVNGVYGTQIPDTFTGLLLVRLMPSTAEGYSAENYGLNWANMWNQTGDIDFTAVADQTIFTITGWGGDDYTAATPLDAAKAALQAAIDKAKAFNTTGLAEIIAAAEAAIADENATIESIQAAAATFEAGVKAYLQYVLTTAIPMIESLNAESLADAITAAKAALANEKATAAELADALFGMIEPARPYIVGILQQTVDVCKPLGIDTSAAEAALSQGDEASTVGMALTLYNLTQTAIPAIQGVVTNLKAYMTTFSNGAAEALAEDFAKLESDIANGNIAAVKNDIVTLMTNGKPYLQADIEKLEGYAEVLNSADITADVAAMKKAVEEGSFANLLAAVEQFKAHFLAAAPDFVAQVKFAAAGFKDAGKTNAMEQLEDAIKAAEDAIADENATIVTVGLAVRNLIVAVKTHIAANSTYTIAGTKDLTGTEEDWQIVEANNMTLVDGLYTWTAENITVTAENQPEFKVVITDIEGNQTWVPASEEGDDHNWVITPEVVGGEGVFNITITYNAKTQEIDVTGENVEVEGIVPDGTYYVMSANEGTLINAEGALDAKGAPITFTFSNNAYTIEGADFFSGKQWTVANAFEGMSGYYTISTPEGFLAVSATNTLEQIADGTADAAVWVLLEKAYWEDIVNSTYTIAGTKNLTDTGNDWDIDEANQMTLNEETGLFEKTFKRIAIDAENQPEFKVVQTNMAGEQTWYPENNWVITTDYVGGEGLYDITITFDPSDFKEVGVIPVKRIVFPENAIVYDFEAAADAGENPANKNGSAANGQAFYGWENPEKTDSKRQDYKGYEWAEGSVLPEVCHVWRRSDRINGNVAGNGGLKCPSNKEMAVDGLTPGSKVIIVYDAENATDKEIILAIGDGSSDETLTDPRATATIDGIEAVTGETTIASGAVIVVKSVTPAENGSGYIVFQVKKGMVIKQIAVIPMSELMVEAIALAADDEAVAVGKLREAIQWAQENNDESNLQDAVDQFKDDNLDQEKDETAKVATNGWKKFDGSNAGVCATQFAPAITTYDGRTAQLAEVFEGNGDRTGTIIYQDITGLENGTYKVGFYGNAFSTSTRDGFECTMEDGATDVAYVFANDEKEYISARIATSTTENDFRQFDVEVTDGNIKLGMGKDTEKSTNWHTMQIYQLTWFVTAKELYAANQAELVTVIAEAEALLADENKTDGKEALQLFTSAAKLAVGSNMYNNQEIEAVIGNLKALIAGFKKANWFIDFAAGEYYVIDAESGLKMAAGHDWGTRGIVNELGLDLTLTPYTESRTVTIDSRVNNNGSHFLGENLYMDSSEWGWALEYQGFGFYILEPNSGKYINIDLHEDNLVLSDTPREWIIVSKDGVRAELLEEMAAATKDAPVDATGLIVAQNFNRNDARNAEAWIVSEDCTNKNLSGGNNVNNCAESFHSTFTIMQTISDAPAGFYQLTAQGFYRQDEFEGDAPAAPVFFANEINGDVPALAEGGPNGMSTASEAFTNGDYTIEPITFEVKEDGMMYIGITASTNTQWVIWDNFQLKYFGIDNPTTGISEVVVKTVNDGAVYNLNGQKVMNPNKGLYIINGKKQLVK